MKHAVDPRTGVTAEEAVWHADKNMEDLVVDIVEKAKPGRWMETGTHLAWTSLWARQRFPSLWIYTVENNDEYFRLSGENLSDSQSVLRGHGDSREFLQAFAKSEPLTLFWLDAHFWEDHPLRGECEIVSKLDRYIVLVDDFHCGDDFPGDPASPAMVESLGAKYWRPNYSYRHGFSGYALWTKGIEYTPPMTMRLQAYRVE